MKHLYEDELHEFNELCSLYQSNEDVKLFLSTCADVGLLHSYDSLMIKCGKYRWLGLHEFKTLVESDTPYPDDLRLTEDPDIKINSLRFSIAPDVGKYNYSVWNNIETGLWNVAIIHINTGEKPVRNEYLVSAKEVCMCIRKAALNQLYIPTETEPEEEELKLVDVSEDLKDILENDYEDDEEYEETEDESEN